jgi:hypothetical protein
LLSCMRSGSPYREKVSYTKLWTDPFKNTLEDKNRMYIFYKDVAPGI